MKKTTELPDLHFAFQMTKKVLFEVHYYRLGNNTNKHFSTSAGEFNRPKTDWNICGQAQEDLLKPHNTAYNFYKKWDHLHITDLTEDQYMEMRTDIEVLKEKYNFYIGTRHHMPFDELREFSKKTPKKIKYSVKA